MAKAKAAPTQEIKNSVTIERSHLEDLQELWFALDYILEMVKDSKNEDMVTVYYMLKPINDRLSYLFPEHLDQVLLDSRKDQEKAEVSND